MKPEPLALCRYCDGIVRTFAAGNPHANVAALRRARWHGCCRYWTTRGIPADWWQ